LCERVASHLYFFLYNYIIPCESICALDQTWCVRHFFGIKSLSRKKSPSHHWREHQCVVVCEEILNLLYHGPLIEVGSSLINFVCEESIF
jgi:hypothetical protein